MTSSESVRATPEGREMPQESDMTARAARRTRTITWAGRLVVFYGAAHTIGALTVEGAAKHASTWFSRGSGARASSR